MVDEGTAGAALDDEGGDPGNERGDGGVDVGRARDAEDLGLAGEEDVHVGEEVEEGFGPAIFGVVVGVERDGEAGLLEVAEEVGESGLEASLEVERGEVEVACRREEIEVEVGDRELGDGAWVGEDVALGTVGEEDGDAGGGGGVLPDVGGVDTGGAETTKGDAAEVVVADEAREGDACAERGGVVRDDGGGAAKGGAEAAWRGARPRAACRRAGRRG